MVDTVGKFIGKTPEDTESDHTNNEEDLGATDPEKYKNLFDALISIAEDFEDNGKLCQIILVDNDIPLDVAEEYRGFQVAHYRSNGMNGLPIGLIDDWESTDDVEPNVN